MADALDTLVSGIMAIEAVSGDFELPVAADFNFPLGVASYSVDPRMAEGLQDANGKASPPRMFTNGLLGNVELSSYLMEPVDPTVATGAIEIGPMLELSGFRKDETATNISYVWDGNTSCATASMRLANRSCGTGTTGIGTDFRGMKLSTSIIAETTGAEFKITATGQAAIEGTPETSKAIITDAYINDAHKRNIEMFIGSLTIDAADVPADGLSLVMNSEIKEQKTPVAGKNGIAYMYEAMQKPMASITAPVGDDTATWWPNIINSAVIGAIVYTGTFVDITMTDLVIANIARNADGKVKLTQDFSPSTITIDFK